MFDPTQLGRRIKSLRLQKELSQDRLAELAGLNGKYVGEVERGKANISILNLAKIAEALETPLASIMDCEHELGKEQIQKQLHQLIDEADEKNLMAIYRLVGAVVR